MTDGTGNSQDVAVTPQEHSSVRAVTVDAVVIEHRAVVEGEPIVPMVLLVKRRYEPFRGHWALPGGYADYNETLAAAAVRELQEETGIIGHSPHQIGIFDSPLRHPQQAISVAFKVHSGLGAVPVAGSDATNVGWWPVAMLPRHIAFDHREIIAAAQRMT